MMCVVSVSGVCVCGVQACSRSSWAECNTFIVNWPDEHELRSDLVYNELYIQLVPCYIRCTVDATICPLPFSYWPIASSVMLCDTSLLWDHVMCLSLLPLTAVAGKNGRHVHKDECMPLLCLLCCQSCWQRCVKWNHLCLSIVWNMLSPMRLDH